LGGCWAIALSLATPTWPATKARRCETEATSASMIEKLAIERNFLFLLINAIFLRGDFAFLH
jgi:hypothetical protein